MHRAAANLSVTRERNCVRAARQIALVLLATAVLAGCSSARHEAAPSTTGPATSMAPPPDHSTVTVEVKDMKFTPANITIKPGQTVRWAFADTAPHTVEGISDGALEIHSAIIREGEWSHKFTSPGIFRYLCTLHPEMKGVVEVRA